MWRLTSIRIKNIVSFHEAELTVEQGVATLIFGRNEDNAAQPCNGSGKSSLIEAISFALTGEQLRKVKSVEEIINDDAEEASVSLRLTNDYDGVCMTINRRISRDAPQLIQILRQTGPYDTDTEEIIQPTVSDYNKYILHEIGLSKDDIYNNFILCDNKYEGFFDCSDKSKKEIINRFSNGVLVDESIARVQADMVPVAAKLTEANNAVIGIKGSISAIERELEQVDDKTANARLDRQRNIERLDEQMSQCQENIEEYKSKCQKGEKRLRVLKRLQSEVASMEESDMSMLDAFHQIKSMCDEYELGTISDFEKLAASYRDQLAAQHLNVNNLTKQMQEAEDELSACKKEHSEYSDIYRKHSENDSQLRLKDNEAKTKIRHEIDIIDGQLDDIEATIKSNKKHQSELEAQIARNTVLLDGAVTCPKCQHQFIVDENISVEEMQANLSELRREVSLKKSEVVRLNKRFEEIDDKAVAKSEEIQAVESKAKERLKILEAEHETLQDLSRKAYAAENKVHSIKSNLTAAQNGIDSLAGKIDVLRTRLFGEINGILEGRVANGEQFVERQESSIAYAQGMLKQYEQSKQKLLWAPEVDFAASLKASLDKYHIELSDAEAHAFDVQSEYDTLKEQEVHFTMFKSYIARKKIDALSLIVNDFLEKIGSDIRLRLEGFTVTKTGKLRDKISVMVMRDGIDCGSYHKFSGGEKARLNLACILALHTLTNSNCEDGKGLDFIIIDELLDKSDEVGMATYCEALNKLHQTALLITQGGVSESYPHRLLVVKQHGVSIISDYNLCRN